ncbi:hypothetical protein AUW26_25160 [Streptomyces sp. CC71]|nr:hypothetical protein AUW26_25160 [Streptomyces sp. CC71]
MRVPGSVRAARASSSASTVAASSSQEGPAGHSRSSRSRISAALATEWWVSAEARTTTRPAPAARRALRPMRRAARVPSLAPPVR